DGEARNRERRGLVAALRRHVPRRARQHEQDRGTPCRFPDRHEAPPLGVREPSQDYGTAGLRNGEWRSQSERQEARACGKLARPRGVDCERTDGCRRDPAAGGRRGNWYADGGGATGLRVRALRVLMAAAVVMMLLPGAGDGTRVRV